MRKAPIAAYEDRRFAAEAEQVESTTFLAHIRFASTGGLEKRNTHPFEQDGRLFAHNGVLGFPTAKRIVLPKAWEQMLSAR